MNVSLLRQIQEQIRREPRQFDMLSFFSAKAGTPNCGTAACIAGWAFALTKGLNPKQAASQYDTIRVELDARKVLGLNAIQSNALFYVDYWPEEFRWDYEDALENFQDYHAAAEIAIRRIDHMIREGE